MKPRANSMTNARPAILGAMFRDCVLPVSFTVYGQCYSMKNSKLVARGRTIKHPKARKFEQDFALQVPAGLRDLRLGSKDCLLRAIVTVWYPSWKQDVDFAIIYDLLQKTGVVSNDRWIRHRVEFGEVDKANPRVELTIEAI